MDSTTSTTDAIDELVDLSIDCLRGSPDVLLRDSAAVPVAIKPGMLVLAGNLEGNLREAAHTPGYLRRSGGAMLDVLNLYLAADDGPHEVELGTGVKIASSA